MKGAMADPLVRTIKTPKSSNTRITGRSQNFFLTFKKDHKSFKNSICLYFGVNRVSRCLQDETNGF